MTSEIADQTPNGNEIETSLYDQDPCSQEALETISSRNEQGSVAHLSATGDPDFSSRAESQIVQQDSARDYHSDQTTSPAKTARKINELRDQLSNSRNNGTNNDELDNKNLRAEANKLKNDIKENREQLSKLKEENTKLGEEITKRRTEVDLSIQLFEMLSQKITDQAFDVLSPAIDSQTDATSSARTAETEHNIFIMTAKALLMTHVATHRYLESQSIRDQVNVYLESSSLTLAEEKSQLASERTKLDAKEMKYLERKQRAYHAIRAGYGALLRQTLNSKDRIRIFNEIFVRSYKQLKGERDQFNKYKREQEESLKTREEGVASQLAIANSKEERASETLAVARTTQEQSARNMELSESAQKSAAQSRADAEKRHNMNLDEAKDLAKAEVSVSNAEAYIMGFIANIAEIGLCPAPPPAKIAAPPPSQTSASNAKPARGTVASQTNKTDQDGAKTTDEKVAVGAKATEEKVAVESVTDKLITSLKNVTQCIERARVTMKESASTASALVKVLDIVDAPSASLPDKLRCLKDEVDRLLKAKEESFAARQTSEGITKTLRDEESRLKHDLQALAKDAGERKSDLAQLKADIDSKKKELVTIQQELDARAQELESVTLKKESLEKEIKSSETKLKALDEKCKDKNLSVNEAKRTLACLEEKYAKTDKEKQDLIERIVELEKNLVQLEEQERRKTTLEVEIHGLTECKKKLMSDCHSLSNKLQR